jgi:hypothetical protein
VLAVALLSSAAACDAGSSPRPVSGVATDALARLEVRDHSIAMEYERAAFGQSWADVDRNGCDTRNDILNRDLDNRRWRDRTRGCVVIEGDLTSPYTGSAMHFVKQDADEVQIDHVVALGAAWGSGASAWDDARRTQFANDPLNLLAVDGDSNQSKGDADAASWLPPDTEYRCEFVARQIAVKAKWQLWVTSAERDAMSRVLAECPGQALPR